MIKLLLYAHEMNRQVRLVLLNLSEICGGCSLLLRATRAGLRGCPCCFYGNIKNTANKYFQILYKIQDLGQQPGLCVDLWGDLLIFAVWVGMCVYYCPCLMDGRLKIYIMSVSDFEIITKLGEGAYSSVYKVRRLIDETVYALKKVKLVNMSTRQIHNAVNEVRILASIRHPNIVCYKQAFYDAGSKSLCIVMEYADGGDLLQKIFDYKKKGQFFDEAYVWDIFSQVLVGLEKLHELGILHRDIKSANVFLTKNGTAKLGDMNVSKVVRKEAMCETQTGTPYYASPEVWKDQPYNVKSDIWSLGCVLYEMINLKPPFRARDMEGLYRKVTRGYYSKINKSYSEDLSKLLRHLIKVDPNQRLTCSQVLQLPIMKKRLKKLKDYEIEEESILLKTIKLTKNINYLTEKLPKPNYSPLRYKSLLSNRSTTDHHKPSKKYDLQISLPPLKSNIRKSIAYSERGSKDQDILNRKAIRNQESLPKLAIKYRNHSKGYIY